MRRSSSAASTTCASTALRRRRCGTIAGLYRCGDGRWVRLHTNFPHHRAGCSNCSDARTTRRGAARACRLGSGEALETAAAEAGLVGDRLTARSPNGMRIRKAQAIARAPFHDREDRRGAARAVAARGDARSPACACSSSRASLPGRCAGARSPRTARTCSGYRRALAGDGALVIDNGRGKLSTSIDLREAHGRAMLADLMSTADIVVQGYRPGAMDGHGFGPEDAARIRPGIIYVSLSAYGRGPVAGAARLRLPGAGRERHQCGGGRGGGAQEPKALPCQAIDHATGHLWRSSP